MSKALRFDEHVELTLLRAEGATHVICTYSGGGDSGGVDLVRAVKMPTFHLEDGFSVDGDDFEGAESLPIPDRLKERLGSWFGDEVMPQTGWWNNEGGGGTIALDLTSMEVRVEHYDNGEQRSGEHRQNRLAITGAAAKKELAALSDEALALASSRLFIYEDDGHAIVDCYDYSGGKSKALIPATAKWLTENLPASFFPYEEWNADGTIERTGKKFEIVVTCTETLEGERECCSEEYEIEVA